jgi:hypothetical protein
MRMMSNGGFIAAFFRRRRWTKAAGYILSSVTAHHPRPLAETEAGRMKAKPVDAALKSLAWVKRDAHRLPVLNRHRF